MSYRALPVTASPLTEVTQYHVCVETYRVVTLEVCVVSLPCGAVLAVRQTQAHSDVILAVQFLIF